MKNELIKFYEEYKKVVAAYNISLSTMYFDERTVCPKNGIPYRNEMIAILAGEAFDYQMNKDALNKLHALYDLLEDGEELKTELKLYFRSIEKIEKLPKDVYVRHQKVLADSQEAWHEAKHKNDYSLFKDHLIAVIEATKEQLSYLDKTCGDYDYLLDTYQIGTNTEYYDNFFNKVKTELLPLIQKIVHGGKRIDDSKLTGHFDIKTQEAFLDDVQDYLKVNRDECFMSTTEHPFTSFFSTHEARITTRYDLENLMYAISSTIHEYGHALYSLQIDEKYESSSVREEIGFAMHESQSRFLENHIGKNKAMWKVIYPKLQAKFPEALNDVSLDEFYNMMNVSKPSFIRTEADELTYPIHVLIRYELEKEIFSGNCDYDKLEDMWNDKYEEYLGIRPTKSSEGILQDMHWGAAYLGYFPTYALGSAYAAQFYNAISKELNVEEALENDQFEVIAKWLKENIHQYGGLLTADEIMLKATGEAFNPDYYINYLKDKFTKLYF